jgi:hypothetical protein
MTHQDYIEYQALKKRYPVIPLEGFQTLAEKLDEAELVLRVRWSMYDMSAENLKVRKEFLEDAGLAPYQFKQDEEYAQIYDDMVTRNATLPYYQKDVDELKRLIELEKIYQRDKAVLETKHRFQGHAEPVFETKPFTTEQMALFD